MRVILARYYRFCILKQTTLAHICEPRNQENDRNAATNTFRLLKRILGDIFAYNPAKISVTMKSRKKMPFVSLRIDNDFMDPLLGRVILFYRRRVNYIVSN